MSKVWTFDQFSPGMSFGRVRWSPDRAAFLRWNSLFRTCPVDQATLPPGMIAMVSLRAYMTLLASRPPGNIHALQQTRIQHLPLIGAALDTELRCLSCETRNGRRWVRFETLTSLEDGKPCFSGEMTMLWAA